jgi:hypothetical protein
MTKGRYGRRADSGLAGSALRDQAAGYLDALHGPVELEKLVEGKKVDIVCKLRIHGKPTPLFVEAKDKGKLLIRDDLVHIWADYQPLVTKHPGSSLLVVSRLGLAPGADKFIDTQAGIYHQTIWELEDETMGLIPYVEDQQNLFTADGLSRFYVETRARPAEYDKEQRRSVDTLPEELFGTVKRWLNEEPAPPLAILGGYGAGKSSFAARLVSAQAKEALSDPTARRPVLIKLGDITRSTGIEGLLGTLFTSVYEVQGYSFRRFEQLNARGRQADDGIDQERIGVDIEEYAGKQCRTMSQREQCDIDADVLQPVQEEDDTEQKQQVIVTRHHMLCAEIEIGNDVHARIVLDERLIPFSHAMSRRDAVEGSRDDGSCQRQQHTAQRRHLITKVAD